MRLTIERSALLKALNHVQSVVERRNTIPILSNVLVAAQGDTLKLTATDLDIEISESAPAEVERQLRAIASTDGPEDPRCSPGLSGWDYFCSYRTGEPGR